MKVNQDVNKPHGGVPFGPGTTHTPSCGCCVAYQAVKTREKIKKGLVTIQNHIATHERSPAKPKFEDIVLRLADLCIQYEEAEKVLIRTAESEASSERQQAAVRLTGTMIAKAGEKLDLLIDEFAEIFAEQKSKEG